MKLRASLLMILPLVFFLEGCAGKTTRPDWLAGDTPRYQESEYLMGRGEGDTLEAAKDRARADLAKIFSVSVAEESSDVRVFSSGENAGAGEQKQDRTQTNITRALNTRTDQIMQGVQIAEFWQDPATHHHVALAVLRRAPAAMSLRQEINRLDDATRHDLERARNASDLLDKISAASRAFDAQRERVAYQKSLKVVDRSGQGMPSEWTVERLRADLDDLLKRVRIGVRVNDDATGQLGKAVSGGFAAAGFTETKENPDYLVDAALDLADLGRREGWHWMTGALEVKLYENTSGRVRGTQRWAIKASGQEAVLARQRAMEQVDRILKNELGAVIFGFAVKMDDK